MSMFDETVHLDEYTDDSSNVFVYHDEDRVEELSAFIDEERGKYNMVSGYVLPAAMRGFEPHTEFEAQAVVLSSTTNSELTAEQVVRLKCWSTFYELYSTTDISTTDAFAPV